LVALYKPDRLSPVIFATPDSAGVAELTGKRAAILGAVLEVGYLPIADSEQDPAALALVSVRTLNLPHKLDPEAPPTKPEPEAIPVTMPVEVMPYSAHEPKYPFELVFETDVVNSETRAEFVTDPRPTIKSPPKTSAFGLLLTTRQYS
jgi:hypothetical protein